MNQPGLWVQLDHLSGPQRTLLQHLKFGVEPGQCLTLIGPSGVGKSALLAAIAGTLDMLAADDTPPLRCQAQVWLNGRCISGLPCHQRRVGLVWQHPTLFAHLTVAQNLLLAVPSGAKVQRLCQVSQALERAGLAGFESRHPATLSGGQASRVALMRALLAKPEALLLDEPFAALDPALRGQLRAWVLEQARTQAIPVLLVTHLAEDIADPQRVLELSNV